MSNVWFIGDTRYLGVSCERVGYRPISLIEIREIFDHRGVLDRKVTDNK